MDLFEMEEWQRCEKLAEQSGFKLKAFCKPSMLWEREDCILQIYIKDAFEPINVPHILPCPFCGGKPLILVHVRSRYLYERTGRTPYLVEILCSGEPRKDEYYSFLEKEIPGFKATICPILPDTKLQIGFTEAAEIWNKRAGMEKPS